MITVGLVGLQVVGLDVDPNLVRPGWTPLIITVLLGVALVLLFLSLRRQMRKINVPDGPRDGGDDDQDEGPDRS